MESFNTILRRYGIFLGILLGVIVTVLTVFPMYYYASSSSFWMVIIGPVITGFLLPLIAAIMLTLRLRKKIGGFWDYRQAVTGIFIMLLVATVISSLAGLAFEKYIDSDMRERYLRNISNNSIEFMERAGANTEDIDTQLERIDEQIDNMEEATLLTTIRGMMISIIVVFVIALIFAAIFKRERPVFQPTSEP